VVAAVAGAYLVLGRQPAVPAALFGGGIALVNTLLLGLRVQRAGKAAEASAARGTLTLYFGAVERFVFTLAGFGLGMGVLHLPPLPLLLAFAAAQAGYLIAARGASDSPV